MKGESPVIVAARKRNHHVVSTLLQHGARFSDIQNYPFQKLLNVASEKGDLDVVKFAHRKGADLNQEDRNGETPILLSSRNAHYKIVKYLHENGANLNQEGKVGETPILLASKNAHYKIVKYMFENGADAGISDGKGHSILHKPTSDGEMEIVKGLLRCGADPSKGLQVALEFYYGDIVKLLIAKRADVNKVSDAFYHFCLIKT